VHIRPVEVGLEGSKLAEIKSGVKSGDRVILGGQDHYQDGEAVNPEVAQEPASETQQQTGGTIDLDADQAPAGEATPDSNPAGHAADGATPKADASRPSANTHGARAKQNAGGGAR
jgi:hypothetical protein